MRKFSAATGGVFTAGSLSVSPLLTNVAPPAARRCSRVSSPWTGMMRILAAAGGGPSLPWSCWGWFPFLGPLLASSLYRRTLINPYSLYMTVYRESFLMVVLFLCRHLFRLLPFIGIIGMPVLCVTEYHLYRRMFLWKAEKYDFRGE